MKTHKKLIAASMVAAVSMTSPGMQVVHAEKPETETVRMKETAYFLKDAEIYLDKALKTKAGMAEKYASVMQTGASPEADEITYEGKKYYVDTTALTTDVNYLDTAEKNYQAKEKAEADAEDRELADQKVEAWRNYLNTLKQDAETQKDATAMGEIDKELSEIADSVDAIAKEKDPEEDSTAPDYTEDYTEATASTQKIWNYLTDHGFTEIEAAGIMGNIQGECDFNPRATDGGLGLFQWIGGRAKNYIAYAGEENMWDAETQLSYMIHELNTTEHKAYTAIHRASTPAQAACLWDRMFERSAGLSTTKRMEWATYWYSKYATGKGTASVLKESYSISPSQLEANKEFAKSYIQSHNRTKESKKEETKEKRKTETATKTEPKEKENKKTETKEKKNAASLKEKGQKSVTDSKNKGQKNVKDTKEKGQKNVNAPDKKGKKNVTASEEKEKKKKEEKKASDKAKEKAVERKEKETQEKETQSNVVQKKAEEKEMQNNTEESANAGQNEAQSNVNENKAEEKTAQSNAEGNANAVEKEEESNVEGKENAVKEEENKAEVEKKEGNVEEREEEQTEKTEVDAGKETGKGTETEQGDVADTAEQLG